MLPRASWPTLVAPVAVTWFRPLTVSARLMLVWPVKLNASFERVVPTKITEQSGRCVPRYPGSLALVPAVSSRLRP
jgi:hypothetical protein